MMNVTKVKLSAVLLASVMILLSGCSSKGMRKLKPPAPATKRGNSRS